MNLRDVLIVVGILCVLFSTIFVVYLNKAQKVFQMQKLLREGVRRLSAIPQIRGEVTGLRMQGLLPVARVVLDDGTGAARFTEIVCEMNQAAETGTPILLRATENEIPQLIMQMHSQTELMPLANRLNSVGAYATEQEWQSILSLCAETQKKLGAAGAKYSLMAAGSGAVSLLTAFALLIPFFS